ncbi:membrane protein [Bacillus coahuilensis m2-6]|uniref:Membrane protein n=1 Tax=Bacillus coahuilensis p1.1.43 TaxID=1150625 RepID=A0A147K5H0_9BACI|nr:membrane protein [Bacillus coahuilensis m2-6]KUP04883.1 membrane protein [Bacillus coahuilensis p1.1.43]
MLVERRAPSKRISKRALTVWRIHGLIHSLIIIAVSIGLTVVSFLNDWPFYVWLSGIGVAILYTIFFVAVLPSLRWKRWRYEVRDLEIELQHGVIFVKRTLIPMVRVQHVDTIQGPILRPFKLATITISSAATVHEIPALDEGEADDLRNSISSLARVAEDDV